MHQHTRKIILATCVALVLIFTHRASYTDSSLQPRAELSQLDRHHTLRLGCDATKSLRPNETLDYLIAHPMMMNKMIYNDEHKLIYCTTAKIGSSKWKKLFGILNGRIPQDLSDKQLYKMKLSAHQGTIHKYLYELSGPEIRRRLSSYTSVMFVRHPLERLASGYKDKFRPSLLRFKWQMKTSLEILAHYQGREAWQVAEEGPPARVTFEQFARWVADAPPPNHDASYQGGPNDEHWRPSTQLCLPCTVPYTVIGTLDTMDEDAPLLLRLANVTSVTFPVGFRSATPSMTGPLVDSLTPETMQRLLRHFLQDFVLFGYRPEDVLSDNSLAADSMRSMFDTMIAGLQRQTS